MTLQWLATFSAAVFAGGALYISIVPLAGMPLLLASLLGLAESILNVRARIAAGRPPPPSSRI